MIEKFVLDDLSSELMMNNLMEQFNVKSYSEEAFEAQKFKVTNKPIPMDKEINLDPKKTIMSKTDAKGVIEYANDYFIEISGYEEFELMGQPHNIIRHPDMPKTVFKVLWDSLNKGENIHALVKNLAKDGRYYWILTNFEFKYDNEGNIQSYYAKRKAAPRNAIYEIEKLYYTLRNIENRQGMQTALNYLNGLLEDRKMTFNQYILNILNVDEKTLEGYFYDLKVEDNTPKEEEKRKGIFGRLFS